MRRVPGRRPYRRRGVTLLEMLVVVVLIVLMMLILASIFQAATGAMTAMRTYQELDDNLRLLDQTIRADLNGVTAKMTPPNNPLWKGGYFEYGENAPADLQGEDTDDYIAFTTKAPEGRVFAGRFWVPTNVGTSTALAGGTPAAYNQASLPVTVTSKYAEVIYFLRNGNLYRRVLLIMPERQGVIAAQETATPNVFLPNQFQPSVYKVGNPGAPSVIGAVPVGWYGVNDVSARPNDGPDFVTGQPNYMPVPNDLGTLTNRENRAFRQRFSRDYYNEITGISGHRDGVPDDLNADLIPDYYPTLTWTQIAAEASGHSLLNESSIPQRITPPGSPNDLYAFPFVFPGMYSVPEANSLDGNAASAYGAPVGWLHAVDPAANAGVVGGNGVYANHAPLAYGDSLPAPSGTQTWWGFPTFRETASINWRDPVYFPEASVAGPGSSQGQQVHGLQTMPATTAPARPFNAGFLPALGTMPPLGTPALPNIPFGSDGAGNPLITGGTTSQVFPFITLTVGVQVSGSTTAEQLSYVWDDDLIMSGVRSFDVKALDVNASVYQLGALAKINPGNIGVGAGYWDLGYASSVLVANGSNSLLAGTPTTITAGGATTPTTDNAYGNTYGNPLGFGHEGRMPPNVNDNRLDPQRPILNSGLPNNIGDNSSGLTRIRRVWDSWSTDYTNAPAVDVTGRGSPIQVSPLDRPVYPSYPPPYPQAMRGLQIQIRVVDPRNEKVKVLTIRQDFSDKL